MSKVPKILIDGYSFDSMEAQKYWTFPKSYSPERRREEAKVLATSGQYMGSRKYDGAWNMIIKDLNGFFHMRSRTESVNGGYEDKAEWIPWIIEELSPMPNGTVLIGEICFPNNEGSRKITSVLNCLKDKCIERQKKNGILNFYVFDVLAYNGKSLINVPFETRIRTYLEYELYDIIKDNDYVFMADYKEGQELWDLYGEVIASGGEGIVITDKSSSYLPGKRKARQTLKMKKELQDTIDAFIDGKYKAPTKSYNGKEIETWEYWVNEKTGEKYNKNMYAEYVDGKPIIPVTKAFFNGWAAAISFSVMKEGKPVHIGWISGITDIMKSDIVNNPQKLIGKVYELNCMEIECINNVYSLRHAKIINERKDKKPQDCGWEQIAK